MNRVSVQEMLRTARAISGNRPVYRRYVYTVGMRQTNVRDMAIGWARQSGMLIQVRDGWDEMRLVGHYTGESVP